MSDREAISATLNSIESSVGANELSAYQVFTRMKRLVQAAQAQAGKPIAAVDGWFHGECVIRALDPEAVLPVGMALYSQPQAQAGERKCSECGNGEPDLSLYCVRCLNNDHWHLIDPAQVGEPVGYYSPSQNKEELAFSFTYDGDDFVPVYAAPPAKVNQQLLEALQAMLEMSEMGGFGKAYAEDLARAAITAAKEHK